MLELIARGASMGFAAGSTPGPLHTFLMNETLLHGWRRSMIIAISPLITDAPVILLTTVILGQLPDVIMSLLKIVGGLFILWLAYGAWQQSKVVGDVQVAAMPGGRRQTLGRAMMINWLNPAPWLFWATVLGPLLIGGLEQSIWHGAALLIAFYGVFIGEMLIFMVIFNRMRVLDARFIRALLWIAIVVLLIFGVTLIGQGAAAIVDQVR